MGVKQDKFSGVKKDPNDRLSNGIRDNERFLRRKNGKDPFALNKITENRIIVKTKERTP